MGQHVCFVCLPDKFVRNWVPPVAGKAHFGERIQWQGKKASVLLEDHEIMSTLWKMTSGSGTVAAVQSLNRVLLCMTPWTVAHQAPPSMGFSRWYYQSRDWTWVSCVAGRFFTVWATREAQELLVVDKDAFVHINMCTFACLWSLINSRMSPVPKCHFRSLYTKPYFCV